MFKFITGKPLWANVLFAIVLVVMLVFIFLTSLGFLTQHGKILKIPAITGKSMKEATDVLEKNGFDVEIQDSVYMDNVPPLQVIKQFPEADALVKINRTVYITVNRSVPPLVEMPRLIGPNLKSAELILKQYNLKLGDTSYKPDFAKNSVLSQLYQGRDIAPGTKIPMGAVIDLVLGSGLANTDMTVPDLFGLTYREAKAQMDSLGIGMVPVSDPDVTEQDQDNAFIYKQNPGRFNSNSADKRLNHIRPGQMIDVWLSAKPHERITDTTANNNNNY
jgi:beta-lactam-binding protein with PASTA domain